MGMDFGNSNRFMVFLPRGLTMKRIIIAIVILLVGGLLIATTLVNLFACHCTDKADTILNCLAQVEGAKIQWVKDHPNAAGATLAWKDLAPYCQDFWERPVAGEVYHINRIGEPPSAIVREKVDWIPANSEIRFGTNREVQIRSLTPRSLWAPP